MNLHCKRHFDFKKIPPSSYVGSHQLLTPSYVNSCQLLTPITPAAGPIVTKQAMHVYVFICEGGCGRTSQRSINKNEGGRGKEGRKTGKKKGREKGREGGEKEGGGKEKGRKEGRNGHQNKGTALFFALIMNYTKCCLMLAFLDAPKKHIQIIPLP